MNGYNVATELLGYLSVNRAVGHTKMMLEGAKNSPDPVVVIHNESMRNNLPEFKATVGDVGIQVGGPMNAISLAEIDAGKLRGTRGPLAIDNAALQVLLGDLVSTIASLRDEVKQNKKTIDEHNMRLALVRLALNA